MLFIINTPRRRANPAFSMEKAEKRMPVGKLNGIGPDGRMCCGMAGVFCGTAALPGDAEENASFLPAGGAFT